jgi:hypothetical protein
LDITERSEAFSEDRFQVSGVRFQAGSHFFTTDTWNLSNSVQLFCKYGINPHL